MGASVLIVDDHRGFRAIARALFESEGYRVVGEAGDLRSALSAVRTLRPELALVDVFLPDGNGFELARRLKGLTDPPAVVLTSSRDVGDFGNLAAQSGARGFVPKAELSGRVIEELIR